MKCPASSKEVRSPCKNEGCWWNHPRARCGCMAVDAGTTELTEHDVARVRQTKAKAAAASIERGRDKMRLWLRLVEAAEGISHELGACESCGLVGCAGGMECKDRTLQIRVASDRIPLSGTVEMTPEKWMTLITKHGDLVRDYLRTFNTEKEK